MTVKEDNERAIGIAEALGNFAERVSKKPHLHWYMDFDENGKVAMFPEEMGLPLDQAVKRTVDTIKKAVESRSKVSDHANSEPKSELAKEGKQ